MPGDTPLAAIFGCAGHKFTNDEKKFFAERRPMGLILFERNCAEPNQVQDLVSEFRELVGLQDSLVLIDQEGGRVTRLKPPHWRHPPAGGAFVELAALKSLSEADEAARLNANLIGDELIDMGINVDCTPVLDLPQPDADPIIGDRALGSDIDMISALGRAVCDGLLDVGVLPVIKHIPGHGRATVDSHKALPRVDTPLAELIEQDFDPFHRLSDLPVAMTAHVIYEAIDPHAPVTASPTAIHDIVREQIEFDGLLLSDDLSMKALSGSMTQRAAACLDAGCDIALHCNGDISEMIAVADGAREMSFEALNRWETALTFISSPKRIDKAMALERFEELMAG